jgi:hypothetical protein
MLLQAGDADLRAGVKLFLSHAHADKPLVRSIAVQLRALGYDATMDEDEIALGDRILTRVEDAITRADYLILVLSEAAVKSTWVDEEWRTKFEQQMSDGRIEVIPVILGYEANSPPILRGRLHFSGHRLKVLRDAAPAIDAAIREHERRRSLTGLGHEPKRALIESPGVANLRKEFVTSSEAAQAEPSPNAFSRVTEVLVAARVVAATAYDTGTPSIALEIYAGILADARAMREMWDRESPLSDLQGDLDARMAQLLDSRGAPRLDDKVWTARMVFDDLLDYTQAVHLLTSLAQWHELMVSGDGQPRHTEVFEPIRYAVQGRRDRLEPMRETALERLCEVTVSRSRLVLELLIQRQREPVDLHLAALLRMCRASGTVRTATETVQDGVYLDMLSMSSAGLLQMARGLAGQAGGSPAPKHLGAAELFDWALSVRGYPRDATYWKDAAGPPSDSQGYRVAP